MPSDKLPTIPELFGFGRAEELQQFAESYRRARSRRNLYTGTHAADAMFQGLSDDARRLLTRRLSEPGEVAAIVPVAEVIEESCTRVLELPPEDDDA